MSDPSAQSQMLFLFPDSSELRYMREPPKLGGRVRSASGDVWTVADVLKSGIHIYTVTCVAPAQHLGGVRDLAADLLAFARNVFSQSRHAVAGPRTEEPRAEIRTRETNYGRTVAVPIDQRMTDVLRGRGHLGTGDPDWGKLPPDVPNASDAPVDWPASSGKYDGNGADPRDRERSAFIKEDEPLLYYAPPLPKSNLQDDD